MSESLHLRRQLAASMARGLQVHYVYPGTDAPRETPETVREKIFDVPPRWLLRDRGALY